MVTRSAKTGATRGTGLSAVDRDALERALALALASDEPGRADQVEKMLKGDPDRHMPPQPWFEVAHFAAYWCQCHALGLKPWQPPPLYGHLPKPNNEHAKAAALLKRMIDSGLSKFEPDPLKALRDIEPPQAA